MKKRDRHKNKGNNRSTQSSTQTANVPAIYTGSEGGYLDYFGYDGTSIIEITVASEENSKQELTKQDEDIFTAWEKRLEKFRPEDKKALIDEGIAVARHITGQTNFAINFMHKVHADNAIFIGKSCLHLKKLIRGLDALWGEWSEINLPFISPRNRNRYMAIAKRPDCYPYTFLGIDRLEHLCTVTRKSESKDKIGELLSRYEIPFDPKAEMNLDEFKLQIDAALCCERLRKKDLSIEHQLLVTSLRNGVDVGAAFIKTIKNISSSGGEPVRYIEKMIAGGGDPDDKDEPRKPEDFNKLSNRLAQTIDYLLEGINAETIEVEQFDADSFEKLMNRLEKLNEVTQLLTKEAA